MNYWLLVRTRVGSLEGHSSTRRPTVQRGDRAICYAAGWKAIFAVVEVVSDPENDPAAKRPVRRRRTSGGGSGEPGGSPDEPHGRWQWRFAVRPLVEIDVREAPPVEAAGVLPRSLGRHSYIRLTREQFEAAREAIESA